MGLASGLMCVGCVRALVMHATKMFWDRMSVDRVAQELEPSAMSVSAVEILQRTHVREGRRQLLVEAAEYLRAEYAEEWEPQPDALADAGFHVLVSTGDSDKLVPPEEAVRLYRMISEGRLSIMPGARHGLNSVDERLFAEAVAGFLTMNSEDEH